MKPLIGLLIAGLILSACGNASNKKPALQTSLPELETAPAPAKVVEIPEPIEEEPEAEVAAIEPIPEPIIVDSDPQQFIDLDIHQIAKLLGAPLLVRRDGTAEVWQYKGAACTLDLFLYEKDTNLRVKYVDLRGPASSPDNQACMADLLRQHAIHMSS